MSKSCVASLAAVAGAPTAGTRLRDLPRRAGDLTTCTHSSTTSRLAYSEILPDEKGHGRVERLNRTLQTEWAYRQTFTSNTERATALAPWIENYNTQRRHSALGGLPPISRCYQPDVSVHLGG